MYAVIIAAGKATRMSPHSFITPKSFMELESNLPVIRFIIEQLQRVGINDMVLVVRKESSSHFKKLSDEVRIIEIDCEEEFGNLYSVLMGSRTRSGEFLLLMSDHIFELEMVRRILDKAEKTDKAFVLCLDRRPSLKAAEEGLKILIDSDKVVRAGKDLLPVYGIDTGLIWCGPRAASYIEETIKNYGKNCSIKDALNLAVEKNDVDYVDVTGLLWQDIDTLEDLEKAREIYWEILKRDITKSSDGLVSRYINRQISTRISLQLYRAGIFINPDIISLGGFILAILGGLSIIFGHLVIGGLTIQVSSIIDGIDGEIARLFRKSSKRGGIIDLLLDRIADIFIVMAIAISSWPLGVFEGALSLLAAANVVLVNYSTQLLQTGGIKIDALRKIPVTRDVRLLVVALCCIAGYPSISIYYLAFMPLIYIAAGCILLLKMHEEKRGFIYRKKMWSIWPYIPIGIGVRAAVNSVVQNGLRLLFVLLITHLLLPPFSDIVILQKPVELTLGIFIPIIEASLIIYLGSKILISSGVLIEYISLRLVKRLRITVTLIREIIKDFSYLIFATIMWSYSWHFAEIPIIGPYIIKLTTPLISVVIIYMVYRITKRIYNTYREILEDRARQIESKFQP
ncbi:MAG: NTP transferase domain-containing protein [Nitrososphaerota archaeon]